MFSTTIWFSQSPPLELYNLSTQGYELPWLCCFSPGNPFCSSSSFHRGKAAIGASVNNGDEPPTPCAPLLWRDLEVYNVDFVSFSERTLLSVLMSQLLLSNWVLCSQTALLAIRTVDWASPFLWQPCLTAQNMESAAERQEGRCRSKSGARGTRWRGSTRDWDKRILEPHLFVRQSTESQSCFFASALLGHI